MNKIDIIGENLNGTSSPTIEIDWQLDNMEYNDIRGKSKEKTLKIDIFLQSSLEERELF